MTKIGSNLDFSSASKIVNLPNPTANGDAVNKAYLDQAISNLSGVALKAPQDIDCSSNPDYPESSIGDSYYVTQNGKIGGVSGENVNIGDIIFCKAESTGGNQATVGSDFFIAESNRDLATTLQGGVVKLATQTQVNDGTESSAVVTPETLQIKLNNSFGSQRYSTTIGNGTNSTFTISHNLNSPGVIVQIFETNSFDSVIANVKRIDTNNVEIGFTNPPPTNFYTITIRA